MSKKTKAKNAAQIAVGKVEQKVAAPLVTNHSKPRGAKTRQWVI